MSCAVRLRNVRVAFHGNEVVRGVSLDIPGPGVSVLVGRSGSGKTTLLRAINRLNEEFPGCVSEGRIDVDLGEGPEPIWPPAQARRPLAEIRRRIGMVFQTPNVFPVGIWKNLAIPLETVAGCPKREIRDRIRRALEAVHLWDEVRERPELPAERLSGGQQQRLCLARTLALEPAVLLLDEPTASLDVHAARDVEHLLQALGERYPVIMVSHSPAQALRLACRLFVLKAGTVTHSFARADMPDEQGLAALLA